MDIAELGFKVDSTPLSSADKRLKDLVTSSGRAEQASLALSGAFKRLAGYAAGLASVMIAGLGLRNFIAASVEAQRVQAQLSAAIISTGGAAGRSLEQLNATAAALQKVTNYGDEATNVAQGVLLTFTKIAGPQFDRATESVLNVATALQTDLKSAAIQVGKALNDPIRGMTALTRSGITFTDAQKETVKQMLATGNIVGAQTLILKELETQFGGSAKAARETLGGALTSLKNAWGDLFELSAQKTDPLRRSLEALTTAVSDPAFAEFVQLIGVGMINAIRVAVAGFNGLTQVLGTIAPYLETAAYSVGVMATYMVARYVPAMVLSAVQTWTLVGALTALKAALIATGIGALVVAAGYLVQKFVELVQAVGGVGKALSILKDVGLEVLSRIELAGSAMGNVLIAAAASIEEAFLNAFSSIMGAIYNASAAVADFYNSIPGAPGTASPLGGAGRMRDTLESKAGSAGMTAEAAMNTAKYQAGQAIAPLESLKALNEALAETEELSGSVATSGAAAIEAIGGAAASGGAATKKAAEDAKDAQKVMDQVQQAIADAERERESRTLETNRLIGQSFKDLFKGATDSAEGFNGALSRVLDRLSDLALDNAFATIVSGSGIGGSAIGGILSTLFGTPAYAGGTNFHRGGPARVNDGGGGEIIDLPRGSRVYPADVSKQMARGGETQTVNINVNVSGARGNQEVREMVEAGVRSGLAQYDQQLPDRLAGVSSQRWMRG